MITPDELEILRTPEVQEYIREKMGQTERGDLLYNKINKCVEVSSSRHEWHSMFLAIPDCISRDSSRPSRGLWGMIDWNGLSLFVTEKGTLWIRDKDGSTVAYDTPRLAFLKALLFQIEANRGK